MIQDAEILNFKCFKSLYLPELSRINIVSGKNNVGKTTLLEALFIFHDQTKSDRFLKTLGWRGIPTVALDPGSVWAPFFHDLDLERPIEIRLKIDGETTKAVYKFDPKYSPAPKPHPTNDAIGEGPGHISTSDEATVSHSLDISYSEPGGHKSREHLYFVNGKPHLDSEQEPKLKHPAQILPARRRETPGAQANLLSRLVEEKKEGMIEEWLRIMAPVSDLQVSYAGGPNIICDVGLSRLVPLALVGDGMTGFLSILLAMANARGGVLLIDEVENGIHYSVQQAFWKALAEAAREFDCQVIATTHSYEFLRNAYRGIQGLFEPEFRYVRLEKNGSETKAKTFTHQMLGEALDAGWEVR